MKKILTYIFLSLIGKFVIGHSQITFPQVIQGFEGVGICVYGEADINQDGFNDLIATTLDMGPFTGGKVYVYSGRNLSILYTFSHRLGGGNYGLTSIDANLDGYPDIVVPGMTYGNDDNVTDFLKVYSGRDGSELYQANLGKLAISSVSSIGDLNCDRVRDILVGGSWNCVVLSGKDGALIYDLAIQSYYGVIMQLEDINSDSVPDFAVSSDRIGIGETYGTISLFSGASGNILLRIIGIGGGWGYTMATCPDKDGDGKKDLVVARVAKDTVYVYSTKTGQLITEIGMPFGDPGVLGAFIGNLGDLNGDGYDDIAISDPINSVDSESFAAGATFLFSGADFSLISSFYGVESSFFGYSATVLGDLNSDGRKEMAIGAPGGIGKVYIFSICTPGDANQDGKLTLVDVVIKINHVFKSRALPLPASASDDNCNGSIDLGDIICTVNYIFKNQTPGCCFK